MQVRCPFCEYLLSYDSLLPRFCSNCGRSLANSSIHLTEGDGGPTWSVDPNHTIPFPGPDRSQPIGPTPAPTPASGFPDAIGGYRLVRRLGGGGMGTVFEGVNQVSGRSVAVKLLRPEFANSTDALERFRREGKLASTIAHPRCVFVIAADEEAGRPYIVMELMPGANLHDLVARNGPMSVTEAVTRILDVIEGLEEAHRCGLIHRDVKPSNCFIDAQGRVKVGDFGLSKSLMGDVHLTRSGAFLGTLLFAAPEQIRNEHVDHLADVYSVSATLYFLLTGRAPFEGGDAASTLARTVTDPLTPMRRYRPDLPASLDEVVLHGLARSRARRWQSLEDLRLALLPFVPGTHTLGDLGARCAAYTIDLILLVPVELLVNHQVLRVGRHLYPRAGLPTVEVLLSFVVSLLCGLLYFGWTEWRWGCSLGKWLFGLRVRTEEKCDRPSFWHVIERTGVFYLCNNVPALLTGLPVAAWLGGMVSRAGAPTPGVVAAVAAVVMLPVLGTIGGFLLPAVSMRRGNGYRGLHELASGTRTIRLLSRRQREERLPTTDLKPHLPAGMPERVGSFTIRSALIWEEDERLLLGEDTALQRPVWIWLRPESTVPLTRRAEVSRATRPRWVSEGRLDGWHWMAFVASPGCRLPDLIARRRRSWARTLEILISLAEELTASQSEGTLPARLGLGQVWVQPGGRVQLLDTPLLTADRGVPSLEPLEFLRQTAVAALEGRPPLPGSAPRSVRAPLPAEATVLMDRLMGVGPALNSPAELLQELKRVQDQPAEVARPRRGLGLAIQGLILAPGLLTMFLLGPLCLALGFTLSLLGGIFAEDARAEVQARAVQTQLDLLAEPDPLARRAARETLDAELRKLDQLAEREAQLTRERESMLQSVSWFIRKGVDPAQAQLRESMNERLRKAREELEDDENTSATTSEELLGLPAGVAEELVGQPWMVMLILGFWPVVWALGSAVLRGGLSLRLTGSALVQMDGRLAAWWRCLLRTLLVWLPVWLLLLVALGADLWRVAALAANPDLDLRWAAWAAWLCWWLAAGLVALYPWVALRWPYRGPHDALMGTALVPR